MPDGITGKAEGDDLVDPPAQTVDFDVCKAIGDIGPELLSEPVLGSEDEVGVDSLLSERLDRIPGNGQMSAFDERHVGGDDQDPFLFQRTFLKDLS